MPFVTSTLKQNYLSILTIQSQKGIACQCRPTRRVSTLEVFLFFMQTEHEANDNCLDGCEKFSSDDWIDNCVRHSKHFVKYFPIFLSFVFRKDLACAGALFQDSGYCVATCSHLENLTSMFVTVSTLLACIGEPVVMNAAISLFICFPRHDATVAQSADRDD